jgi:protein SCO1/2
MTKENKNFLAIGIIVVLLVGSAVWYSSFKKNNRTLPYYSFNLDSDEYLTYDTPPEHKVGDFSFVSQTGEKITMEGLGDCIYVADYIYTTCPGICKVMTSEMTRVYETFKDNPRVKILSHTSKPEEDSVHVLMQFAKDKGVAHHDRWLFLTGEQKELQRMALEQYGIINPEDLEEEGSFVHTEMFVLVDKNRYIRGYYDGLNKGEISQMMLDMQALLNE